MLSGIAQDLKSLPAESRRFVRYLSIRHYYNQNEKGVSSFSREQVQSFAKGLSFLVNSLSWKPAVTPLAVVENTEETILRLDLRNYTSSEQELAQLGIRGLTGSSNEWSYDDGYGLTPFAWNELSKTKNDPYHVEYTGEMADFIRRETNTSGAPFPIMRGDIFTFLAGRSHDPKKAETFKFAYYRILGVNKNFEDFNRALFRGQSISEQLVDSRNTNIHRSGFAKSGVSDHNRLIERHVIPGYKTPTSTSSFYWLSYDFGGSSGQQHLESHPLGPISAFESLNNGKHVFAHDGGEVIFSLPNGLHGYLLFTSKGDLLDQAPSNIVRYLDGRLSIVYNGISCMDCHKSGMIENFDSVRGSLESNKETYTNEELAIARRLYPGNNQLLKKIFDSDTQSFLASKIGAGSLIKNKENSRRVALEPKEVSAASDVFDAFNADLTIAAAASETELTNEEFEDVIAKNPVLRKVLDTFRNENSRVVKRETFRDFFPVLVKELNLAQVVIPPVKNLCKGRKATCVFQIFSANGQALGKKEFIGQSTASIEDASQIGFNDCNSRINNELKKSGFVCKKIKECEVKSK